MTNLTQAQAQLKELWDNAEQAPPQEGDAFIAYFGEGETQYSIGVARWELDPVRYRILERAKPKAKPRVVMASWVADPDRREAYTLQPDGEWESPQYAVEADDLVDPVPLVELPSRQALLDVLLATGWGMGPVEAGVHADALLKLLEGKA